MNWPPSKRDWSKVEADLPPGADPVKFRAAINAAVRIYLCSEIDPSLWERVAQLARSKSVENLCQAIDKLHEELRKQTDALVVVQEIPTPVDAPSFVAIAAPSVELATKSVLQFGKVLTEVREIADFEAQFARHQEHGSGDTLGRTEMLYHNVMVAWLYVGGQLSDSEGPLSRVMQIILAHILPKSPGASALRHIIRREKRRQA